MLTRLEKVPTAIYESMEEGSFAVAKEIAAQIRKKQEAGQKFVLALPGGRSPESVYKELVRMHKEEQLSFRHVIVFVEYEFFPLSSSTSGVVNRLKAELFDQVDILPENIYYPDGRMPKDAILEFCAQYEEKIQQVGGIDCMLLGIGSNSNIMFNSAGHYRVHVPGWYCWKVRLVKRLLLLLLRPIMFRLVSLRWESRRC